MTTVHGVIDHKLDTSTAVSKGDMYVVTHRGRKTLRKTTCSWKLLVKWKNESES